MQFMYFLPVFRIFLYLFDIQVKLNENPEHFGKISENLFFVVHKNIQDHGLKTCFNFHLILDMISEFQISEWPSMI